MVLAKTSSLVPLLCVVAAAGCSASEGTASTPARGAADAAAGRGGSAPASTRPGEREGEAVPPVITTGQSSKDDDSEKEERQDGDLALELRFVCDSDCAEVEAVATGGNPEYTITWEDGTKSAMRRLCAADGGQDVTVTDTPIDSNEFSYPGASVTATVTAAQLECTDREPDAGEPPTTPPTGEFCVKNPSLEGGTFPGMPPDWTSCLNTPDIGPVGLGIPASDGTGYLGGAASGSELARETFEATLCQPFKGGQTASFQVDLSMSTAWGNPGLGAIEIWGASTSCQNDEMLWASPKLENLDMWMTFCVTINPTNDISFLMMAPAVAGNDPASAGQGGYVILDNIRPVEACE
jgi:hypothetical protein